jgi:methylated-DNA-[protein]-cysteine S-methyltransferase
MVTQTPSMDRLSSAAIGEDLVDVFYAPVETPLGDLLVAATPEGVVRIAFASEGEAEVLDELARRVSSRILRAPKPLDPARRQLDEYFAGRRRTFDLSLDRRLTAGFRARVLEATAAIPYGALRTYREVARAAGNDAAVRAAGGALAANPLPIVVPCHRVLRSDGALGGYRGGLEAKRYLLAHEGGDGVL